MSACEYAIMFLGRDYGKSWLPTFRCSINQPAFHEMYEFIAFPVAPSSGGLEGLIHGTSSVFIGLERLEGWNPKSLSSTSDISWKSAWIYMYILYISNRFSCNQFWKRVVTWIVEPPQVDSSLHIFEVDFFAEITIHIQPLRAKLELCHGEVDGNLEDFALFCRK